MVTNLYWVFNFSSFASLGDFQTPIFKLGCGRSKLFAMGMVPVASRASIRYSTKRLILGGVSDASSLVAPVFEPVNMNQQRRHYFPFNDFHGLALRPAPQEYDQFKWKLMLRPHCGFGGIAAR